MHKIENVKKYLSLFLFCLACSQPKKEITQGTPDDLNPKFASRYSVEQRDGGIILSIDKPWQGSQQSLSYFLYKDSIANKGNCPSCVFVKVPIESIASNSTTHLGLMEVLGVESMLSGFAQSQFIFSSKIRKRLNEKMIEEIGMERGLNVESVIDLDPDMLMAFSSGAENPQLTQLQQLGIPVVMNADYMETSVLGRAEWIKFLAFFVDKTEVANAYFDQLIINYDSLKFLTSNANKPTVMSGTLYGSNWYLPGGENYNAKIIADAGGNYIWQSDKSPGWQTLDFEAVYDQAHDADFWIGAASINSLEELAALDARYKDFETFKRGEIYTYNNRVNEFGGSDYFESGNVYPDRLLADHIKILHPELLPDYQLYYYRKLD